MLTTWVQWNGNERQESSQPVRRTTIVKYIFQFL